MQNHTADGPHVFAAPAIAGGRPFGDPGEGTLSIGTQRSAYTLLVLEQRGLLERRVHALHYDVAWTQFPSGPALIAAMQEGTVHLGYSGAMPPILAVAHGAPIVTLANDPPSPRSAGVVARRDSGIKRLRDLQGRRVTYDRGSSAEWLLVRALAKAGLRMADILPVPLPPDEAETAFFEGMSDAWATSDPDLATAQAMGGGILADGIGITPNIRFYVVRRDFARRAPAVIKAAMRAIAETEADISGHRPQVAAELAARVGVPAPHLKLALDRKAWGITTTDSAVLVEQQSIANHFAQTRRISAPLDAATLALA